jgi:hypothetical protein
VHFQRQKYCDFGAIFCIPYMESTILNVALQQLDRAKKSPNASLTINLCSQGPGTEVTSPEVYESIESEQYVFPAVKEDGISSSHMKFQMNCSIQQKVTAS